MKICYIGNIDAVHTQRWGKAFAEKGHEVHVIYMGGEYHNITALNQSGVSIHLLNQQETNNLDLKGAINSTSISEKFRKSAQYIYLKLPKKLIISFSSLNSCFRNVS